MFLWRCCKGIVPTNLNLARKKCVPSSDCSLCMMFPESIEHSLLLCPWVRTIWLAVCGIRFEPESISSFDSWFLETFTALCKAGDEEGKLRSRIGFTAWGIWKARCEAVFGRTAICPKSVTDRILKAIWEFEQLALTKKPGAPLQDKDGHKHDSCWVKPPLGWLKMNVDGAPLKDKAQVGIGVILRDHEGKPLEAHNMQRNGIGALSAEALALKEGILLAQAQKLDRIVFETDSLILYQAVNKKAIDYPWTIQPIVHDILLSLMKFGQTQVTHTPRTANQAADWLANKAKQGMCCADWLRHPPSSLVGIWNKDGVPAPP